MEIIPSPSMLYALRSQTLSWKLILAELIDNSQQASASQIELTFGPGNRFRIKDDGKGCADLASMLVIGKHMPQSSEGLSRYGIGLKDAACCLWGETYFQTVYRGTKCRASVNWGWLARQEKWEIPDVEKSDACGETGTSITFTSISKTMPRNYADLIAELNYIYMPALLGGRQIVVNTPRKKRLLCSAYCMPLLTHVVEDEFNVGGKGVQLRAGIVQEHECNKKPGFSFIHATRVICCSAVGAGGMNVERVAGTVYLDKQWKLSKNKTELIDDQEALGEAIFLRCREMLEQAHRQATRIVSDQFEIDVSKKLNDAISAMCDNSRERRESPRNKSGTIEPKDSGQTRKRVKKRKPGDKRLDILNKGEFQLAYRDFDGNTIGQVDLPGKCIWLNDNHPHLNALRAGSNKDATFAIALGLLCYAIEAAQQREIFPFMKDSEDFPSGWGEILGSVERQRTPTVAPA